MSADTFEAGDVGTVIQHQVLDAGQPLDISQGSGFQLIFKPPSKSSIAVFARTPTFATNGTDGVLQYATQPGDIPVGSDGLWSIQASFTLGSWTGRTIPDTFTVGAILQ
jgi:hypothetical protein